MRGKCGLKEAETESIQFVFTPIKVIHYLTMTCHLSNDMYLPNKEILS
jgi:hypothetical protein